MGLIDVNSLLQEVSSDAPCGENLQYDPAFHELEQSARGKPEQEFGDIKIPAEEPSWQGVQEKALALLSRTKDLRVAMYLTQALLRTGGFAGLDESLILLRGLLEQHWDAVHPQLDADGDNDPTMRVNALAPLCDPQTVLRSVREVPLVNSRVLGQFSLRDIEIAAGKLSAGDQPSPEPGAIDAAFMEADLTELQRTTEAVNHSLEQVAAIEAVVTERVGSECAMHMGPLSGTLKEAQQVLVAHLAQRGVDAPTGPEETGVEVAGPAGGVAAPTLSGSINGRGDVVRMLDKVCEYFRQHEPSSPVPLLLQRAKRLTSKDFMEIMRDIAPDAIARVEVIRGSDDGNASN